MKNILVVEDDDDIRGLLETILTDDGYAVKSVESVAEASSWLERESGKLDLVLLDFMLAAGNSAGFVQYLHEWQNETARRVPVLMMSAANPLLRGNVANQVDGFLHKPIVIEEMLRRIEGLFTAG
jgi:DNA-binding response OmpR family regulator